MLYWGDSMTTSDNASGSRPDAQEVAYVTARGSGGRVDYYHTDPDCRQLANARKVHEYPLDQVRRNREACSICTGAGGEQPGSDWGHYQALKEAARSD